MNKWLQYVYWFVLGGCLWLSSTVFAINGRTTYQAKIYKPDGLPLESVSVNFRFTVLDPSSSCVLYIEDYAAVNMIGSGGLTSFSLGMGARAYPASGPVTFASVFDNSTPSFVCQAPGVYNPVSTDNRKIVMQFNEGHGWQTLPAMAINSVPYAMYSAKAQNAQSLNGKADTSFVEYSTLAALNCQANEAIKFNGVSFGCIPVGVASSGISSVTTSGTVLITAGTASAPVISINVASMSSDGYLTSIDYAEFKAKLAASSTQIINTLGYAPVSGAAVNSQIQASQLSGDVSGTVSSNVVQSVGGKTATQVSTSVNETLAATSSATADTLVKRNSLGNVTVNDIYANAAKISYVDIYKPSTSFNIRLQAPTSLAANYTLSLPTTSGSIGQVLSTDGSGNLSWMNAANAASATQWSNNAADIFFNTGRVGIGVSSPQYALDVAGSVITGSVNNGSVLVGNDGNALIELRENDNSGTPYIDFANDSSTDFDARFILSGDDTLEMNGAMFGLNIRPTAALTIAAGTSSYAPLKFTSGTLLTSPQSGTMEYDGSNYYLTDSANQRRMIATASPQGALNNTSQINSSGNLTLNPTGSVVVSSPLAVNGGLGVSGTINASGNLNVSGSTVIDGSLKLSNFTSGSVLFAGSNGVVSQNNSKFFWNGNNLGLGTNTPSASLEVKQSSATVKITSTDGISPAILTTNNNGLFKSYFGTEGIAGSTFANSLTFATVLGSDSAVPLQFATYGSVKSTILVNGNMGLGTSAPGRKLHIQYNINGADEGLMIENQGDAGANLSFKSSGAGGREYMWISTGSANSTGAGYMGLYDNTGGGYRMVVNSSGNVGIGTNTPQQKLDVSGSVLISSVGDLFIASGSVKMAGTAGNPGIVNRFLNQTTVNANSWIFEEAVSNWGIYHYNTDDATAAQNSMILTNASGAGWTNATFPSLPVGSKASIILNNEYGNGYFAGKVGVGTASPSAPLHVTTGGVAGWNSVLKLETTNANTHPLLMFRHGASDTGYVGFGDGGATNGFGVYNYLNADLTLGTSSTTMMAFKPSGNIGIGTTSPVTKLDVRGPNGSPSSYTSGTIAVNGGGVAVLLMGTDDTTPSAEYAWIQSHGTRPLHINKVGNNTILNANGGNVGVGTATPASKLEVNGGIKQPNYGQLVVTFDGTTRTVSMPAFLTSIYIDAHQDETYTWRGIAPRLKDTVGCNAGPHASYLFEGYDTTWNGTYHMTLGKLNATGYIAEIEWRGWGTNLKDAANAVVATGSNQGTVQATLYWDGTAWSVQHMQGQVGATPFSCH